MSRKRLRDRLICGYSPDEAVKPDGRILLSDGRPALAVAVHLGARRADFFRLVKAGLSPDAAISVIQRVVQGNGL